MRLGLGEILFILAAHLYLLQPPCDLPLPFPWTSVFSPLSSSQPSPGKAQKWPGAMAEFGAGKGHTLGVHGGVDSGVGGQSWMGSDALLGKIG